MVIKELTKIVSTSYLCERLGVTRQRLFTLKNQDNISSKNKAKFKKITWDIINDLIKLIDNI